MGGSGAPVGPLSLPKSCVGTPSAAEAVATAVDDILKIKVPDLNFKQVVQLVKRPYSTTNKRLLNNIMGSKVPHASGIEDGSPDLQRLLAPFQRQYFSSITAEEKAILERFDKCCGGVDMFAERLHLAAVVLGSTRPQPTELLFEELIFTQFHFAELALVDTVTLSA
jgi:hypothetical protein